MNKKIGVFDSGLGGLSILKELRRIMPNEDFIFYEDSINNPYGDKDINTLLKITTNIVDYLLKEDCKIIVIACNTATTCCMKKLIELYPDTVFIGTVPAIKVAYDNGSKKTIILSTPNTMKSKRVDELVHDFKAIDQELINISGENLANLIEKNDKEEIKKLLNKVLSPYKDSADSIVLGCTHYPLIRNMIKDVLPNAMIFDSSKGVANETKRQLKNRNLLNNSDVLGSLKIINTKDDNLIKRSYEILNSK